jgi:hypothetical protein
MCTFIGTHKNITWHLRNKHGCGQKKGVNFQYTDEPVNYLLRGNQSVVSDESNSKNARCLICNDGKVFGRSAMYSHIANKHTGQKSRLGETYELVDSDKTNAYTKRQVVPQVSTNLGYIDIACIMRVNVLTRDKQIIIGEVK